MKFLLDTCVISEPKQKQPNKKVLEWIDAQDESKLYLSVLTIGEIRKGIARLDSGKKKVALENGWKNCETVFRVGFYLSPKRHF
jgi:tRNA(fMet)-specific endonuclease VapC